MSDRPTAARPSEGRWLTYADAAQLFGISTEALRSLARRHRWDRRSANAVGGQSWVLVPADRLSAAGSTDNDRRLETAQDLLQPPLTAGLNGSDPRPERDTDLLEDRRSEAILTAVREMADTLMGPVHEQLVDLKTRLASEQERADRAETRVRELQEQLQAEMTEHRQVVTLLAQQLAARRSWWRWRRS
jgi:hypothetical protein